MQEFISSIKSVETRFLSETAVRLVLAAILGGIIGLERELKRRPAGLRTNMFICFGSALFTIMSYKMAGTYSGDHTRIAAQIIPGIGFIGAGSILHEKGSITGLTSAATIFVVASIGMATGAGFYLPAIFATFLILAGLSLLAVVEDRLSLKAILRAYSVVGTDTETLVGAVNDLLEDHGLTMQSVQVHRTNGHYRVLFKVDATRNEHEALLRRLRESPAFTRVEALGEPEKE